MPKKFLFLILAFVLPLVATGCAVKGPPEAPKDKPSTFPRSYPTY